jgi:hypothetical protein
MKGLQVASPLSALGIASHRFSLPVGKVPFRNHHRTGSTKALPDDGSFYLGRESEALQKGSESSLQALQSEPYLSNHFRITFLNLQLQVKRDRVNDGSIDRKPNVNS